MATLDGSAKGKKSKKTAKCQKLSKGKKVQKINQRRNDDHADGLASKQESYAAADKPKSVSTNKQRAPLQVGSLYDAVVKLARGMYLYVELKIGVAARVHISEIDDVCKESSRVLTKYSHGQRVKVRVLSMTNVVKKRPLVYTGSMITHRQMCECTMKPSRLTGDLIQKPQIYEIGQKVSGFVSSIGNGAVFMHLDQKNRGKIDAVNCSQKFKCVCMPKKRFRIGHCYSATVFGKHEDLYLLSVLDSDCIRAGAKVIGVLLYSKPDMGVALKLPNGYKAAALWPDVSDCYEDAIDWSSKMRSRYFNCTVLGVDHKKKKAFVSLRHSRTSNKLVPVHDREIFEVGDLKVNERVRGYVKKVFTNRMFVNLGHTVEAIVEVGDEIPDKYTLPGTVVELIVTRVNHEHNSIMANLVLEEDEAAMDPSEFVPGTSVQEIRKRRRAQDSDVEMPVEGAKKLKVGAESKIQMQNKNKKAAPKPDAPIVEQQKTKENAPHLKVSGGFIWDPEELMKAEKQDSCSDSEEEQKDSSKKKRKQKLLGENLSEKKLFEIEKALMDSEQQPKSVDDFDRLVLSSPNSSIIWLNYMTFHLQLADVDKARAVAERALKTISFREEQEKLNVWVALLNLENLYGMPETVNAVFQRALEYNEPLTIYKHLVTIYTKTDKLEAAEQLYNTMVRRFSDNKDVWLNFGTFLMRNGKSDSAHKLLERSLKSLPKRLHVDVISKFAQLEFKYGEAQRGKTMMESVLSSYPKRTDVWSVYLDMISRVVGDLDETRRIFERVITMKLSTMKMKFFFKRYLDFEKQHGTSQTINAVKEKALRYVTDNENCS